MEGKLSRGAKRGDGGVLIWRKSVPRQAPKAGSGELVGEGRQC